MKKYFILHLIFHQIHGFYQTAASLDCSECGGRIVVKVLSSIMRVQRGEGKEGVLCWPQLARTRNPGMHVVT